MTFPFWIRKAKPILVLLLAVGLCCSATVVLAASGGDHGGGTKGWVATDTYRVMNFVVLAVALIFLLRKPVSQALNGRIKGIEEQLAELEQKKREAEEELARYDEKLAQLDEESEKIVADYIRQGEEAKARILEEAKSSAAKLEEQARRTIEQEYKRTLEQLKAEVLEKALAKAEEMLQKEVTADDQDRLVDEYLEKVGA
jgi:F-type H+-transporting ATPase subunit b